VRGKGELAAGGRGRRGLGALTDTCPNARPGRHVGKLAKQMKPGGLQLRLADIARLQWRRPVIGEIVLAGSIAELIRTAVFALAWRLKCPAKMVRLLPSGHR
jgi:hypothetical protein